MIYILLFEVNGEWSNWSVYSKCSQTCGIGKQTRTRTCTNPAPSPEGKDCIGQSSDSQDCIVQTCPGKFLFNQ